MAERKEPCICKNRSKFMSTSLLRGLIRPKFIDRFAQFIGDGLLDLRDLLSVAGQALFMPTDNLRYEGFGCTNLLSHRLLLDFVEDKQ